LCRPQQNERTQRRGPLDKSSHHIPSTALNEIGINRWQYDVRYRVVDAALKWQSGPTASGRFAGLRSARSKPMRRNHPESPYGHSKLATERALAEAARATGIELVIIRPPLVYGPGVRANFEALLRLVASGAPLPFAALDNRRSFLHADNLTDLIAARHSSGSARMK
jgi:uncharacterized protein YbjT (DUF2867 family)